MSFDPTNAYTTLIIGMSGKIGTGKNYLLDHVLFPHFVAHQVPCVVMAFADALKMDAIRDQGFVFDDVFGESKPYPVRKYLQEYGEVERKKDSDVWVKRLHPQLLLHGSRGIKVVLISDLRHENEAKYIYKMGGLCIRIEAPVRNKRKLLKESNGDEEKMAAVASHVSETSLDSYSKFDIVIQNDANTFLGREHFIEQFNKHCRLRK